MSAAKARGAAKGIFSSTAVGRLGTDSGVMFKNRWANCCQQTQVCYVGFTHCYYIIINCVNRVVPLLGVVFVIE